MIPGIGIGVGFGRRRGAYNASRLTSDLVEIYGASLVGLILPDDATLSGSDATALPARVGSAATAWANYPTAVVNGRRMLTSDALTDKGFALTSTGARTAMVIGSCSPLPPSWFPFLLLGVTGWRFYLAGDKGVSTWRTTSGELTGTRYDGTVNTETVGSGLRLWSCTEAFAQGSFWLGGYQGYEASWSGTIGALALLSVTQTATQRSRALTAFKRYYPALLST